MNDAATAILDARPVSEELVSPQKFIDMTDADRAKIKSASIVPPRLGDKHFGKILVQYKSAIYKVG